MKSSRWDAGWDWAAGQLLRGVPPEQVYHNLDFMFDYTEFDEGARKAVRKWEESFTWQKKA